MALLRLAQGRIDVAAAQLRRRVAESDQPIARARVLCAAAEILIVADDIDSARVAAEELSTVATELGSSLLRGHAALANGAVLLTAGDATGALRALRRAIGAWIEPGVPSTSTRSGSRANLDLGGGQLADVFGQRGRAMIQLMIPLGGSGAGRLESVRSMISSASATRPSLRPVRVVAAPICGS